MQYQNNSSASIHNEGSQSIYGFKAHFDFKDVK